MIENLKEHKKQHAITRKSTLEELRLAEKNSTGVMRELFGKKLISKNGKLEKSAIKASDKLKTDDHLAFNLDNKENKQAYYNVRLSELLPKNVYRINLKQFDRGESGIATFKNGDYYFSNGNRAEVFKTVVTVLAIKDFKEVRNSLGFTSAEEERLADYSKFSQVYEKQSSSSHFRTLKNRFEDHEILLDDLLGNKYNPEFSKLRSVLFPTKNHKPFFIDIGPGLADIDNADKYEVGGQGTPAVTSAEMAEKFPNMPVVALDLPEAVAVFMGKGAQDRYNKPYHVTADARQKLLKNKNVHVVSGNGLKSLKSQWENPETNPIKERRRPSISKETTIFIRAANSIEIFCSWYAQNGKSPSLREALKRMATDFKDNPVMLFFSKEIMIKPAGSTQWTIVGNSSEMGFNHKYYSRLDRNGKPPYSFRKDRLDNL